MLKKDIFINLENVMFNGDILDIAADNHGIVYNLYKAANDEVAIDYVDAKSETNEVSINSYDNCILFFSLNNYFWRFQKSNLIKKIYDYLRDDGCIYLWDFDKGYSKIFYSNIKIMLPGRILKNITMKDFNILKDNSLKNNLEVIGKYFQIEDLKTSDQIYYIKGKKRSMKHEGIINSDQFKIHSQ